MLCGCWLLLLAAVGVVVGAAGGVVVGAAARLVARLVVQQAALQQLTTREGVRVLGQHSSHRTATRGRKDAVVAKPGVGLRLERPLSA